jgi:hypothetical protein
MDRAFSGPNLGRDQLDWHAILVTINDNAVIVRSPQMTVPLSRPFASWAGHECVVGIVNTADPITQRTILHRLVFLERLALDCPAHGRTLPNQTPRATSAARCAADAIRTAEL